MFKFLKDKLKSVLSKFSKKVEEEAAEEKVEVVKPVAVAPPKPIPTKPAEAKPVEAAKPTDVAKPVKVVPEGKPPKPVPKPIEAAPPKEKPPKPVEVAKPVAVVPSMPAAPPKPEAPEKPEVEVAPPKKKGFFAKIAETFTTKKISAEKFDGLFWDLELALLENNVAVEVIEKIKADLKSRLVEKPIPRKAVQETIASSLHNSIEELFLDTEMDLVELARKKKPLIICFVGVNGSGKTTSIAKVARMFQKAGFGVVLAASDTFRAAAIDQLQVHADRLGVKLVKHDYGSDPAAVAFDAIKHAQATNKDVVLIDTAGRLHSNINLMDEMRKIVRVAKPDLKIFVGESITGNDCVEQAKEFDAAVGIDGIILAKADVDEKGGAAISVSYVTKKPILYLGTGQGYDDLMAFDKERLLASIGL